jgi:hypothetical protein
LWIAGEALAIGVVDWCDVPLSIRLRQAFTVIRTSVDPQYDRTGSSGFGLAVETLGESADAAPCDGSSAWVREARRSSPSAGWWRHCSPIVPSLVPGYQVGAFVFLQGTKRPPTQAVCPRLHTGNRCSACVPHRPICGTHQHDNVLILLVSPVGIEPTTT